jgi:hypothetical protein
LKNNFENLQQKKELKITNFDLSNTKNLYLNLYERIY